MSSIGMYAKMALFTVMFLLLISSTPARAQSQKEEIENLKAAVQSMQKTIEELNRKIAEIEKTQDKTPQASQAATQAPAAPTRFDAKSFVTKGDFPGSFKIPGTNTSMQLGGSIQTDLMYDFKGNIGSKDSFVTNTIPTTGPSGSNNTNFSIRNSRVFVKTDTPSDLGHLTTLFEWDFFGSGNTTNLRLRHAYGQMGSFLVGQTWSTFMDNSANPITLDHEGPGGFVVIRLPMVRWTQSLAKGLTWATAIEKPSGEITAPQGQTGDTRNPYPDFATNLRWEQDWGHLQAAGLFRGMAFNPTTPSGDNQMNIGWGFNLTGELKTWGKNSILFGGTFGKGIARYMNDMGGLGLDAVPKRPGSNDLGTPGTFGGTLAYGHWWSETLNSNFVYSYSFLDNLPGQATLPGQPAAYRSAQYGAANLLWYFTKRVMLGVEYLYGYYQDYNRDSGTASRLQSSVRFNF
ncbi:MAG: DcaP family trimeric outer membrane transporter [Proteobacteria bacterium]|nr:DcaP family trimeric outer membrane transporter [Pseudomonadota bacterium]